VSGVRPGDPLPELRQPLTRADLVRYAGASGDFNPIHWDEEAARAAGLPGVIAHGMLTMGVAARAVAALAGDPRAIRRLKVRFPAVMQPGQTLTVGGEVATVEGGHATVRFWAEDDRGERVLSKGEAELDLDTGASV
jgi:acyl dehydratase